MKKAILFFIIGSMFAVKGLAQTQPRSETFRSSEETIMVNEKASFFFQYMLDEFTPGTIYLSNGRQISGRTNYNTLMDAIQIYDDKRNLNSYNASQPIDSVRMGDHLFVIIDSGFIEIFHTPNGPLYLHRSISYKAEGLTRGAYGSIERTSATERVSHLFGTGPGGEIHGFDIVKLPNNEGKEMEVIMRYRQSFYIPAGEAEFIELSNRRSTSRAFPQHSKAVDRFIRQNNIDFDSVESMKELAEFLHSL